MQHLGLPEMHDSLMQAMESVLRDAEHLTPDMGGQANTLDLGAAVVAAIEHAAIA
jgi:tartrate dehydrogenase/decarboxylase/D-malate dehydrogenase